MQGFGVLKAYDLSSAPISIGDCFDIGATVKDAGSFTSTIRVGFHTHVSADEPGNWWSREITFSEYELHRWLLEHGADDGETVLLCWAGVG